MGTIDIDLTDINTDDSGGGNGWTAFDAGVYRAIISEADIRELSSGNGQRLAIRFELATGGTHFEGLNIKHTNPVAERIAHEHLAMIADALSLPRDFMRTLGTEALEGRAIVLELTKKKAKDSKYGDAAGFENNVRAYQSVDVPAVPEPEPAPVSGSAPASNDVPF